MTYKQVCVYLSLLLGFALSRESLAISCVMVSLTPDAQLVSISGERYTDKYVHSMACEDIRVAVGEVRVLYAGPQGPLAGNVKAGQYVLPPEARGPTSSVTTPSSWTALLNALGDVLAGGVRRRVGQVHGGTDPMTAALPSGKLVASGSDLVIPLPLGPGETVESFHLRRGAKLVYSAGPGDTNLTLPGARLCVECQFTWDAVIAGTPYRGTFTVSSAEDFATLERRLTSETAAEVSADIRALRIAAAFQEAGFLLKARQLLAESFPP